MSRAADLLARVRLIRTNSIGPVTYRQLLLRFGSAEAALDALPDLATRGGGRPPAVCDVSVAQREIEQVSKLGARYLAIGEGLYPRALAEADGAPPLLIAKGDLGLFERPMIAIVGARNASAAASRFARQLAWDLGREDVVVVSGLARGIDTAAHDGAMETGTIGCAAGGIDIFYPPENEARQRRMFEVGVVLSETPPGYEPRARDFPRRNRIIAGLSAGTVVVEAAPRSGSLITARMAAEMGREVMAVPGSPLDQRAQGCNGLIREGATLVQNAAEVLEAVRPGAGGRVQSPTTQFQGPIPVAEPAADERARVEELLGPSPAPIDDLVRMSGLASGAVQLILLELDLAGRLDRHAGGQVSLRTG
ncbi:DNA-processing protein DprA [Sphingomonas sp. KRR8]|uniref:DNA-processing protein DprA n=1 Tax=Sphingomonas sp. KRR8 TaxID=2942996 RepID=UPI002020F459|nr:DNA-processing protein DprA [Sphingomonas sp. KRR8]URD61422.1 DNA-processing protein DprA [Sphingomonas sp. KRR8]